MSISRCQPLKEKLDPFLGLVVRLSSDRGPKDLTRGGGVFSLVFNVCRVQCCLLPSLRLGGLRWLSDLHEVVGSRNEHLILYSYRGKGDTLWGSAWQKHMAMTKGEIQIYCHIYYYIAALNAAAAAAVSGRRRSYDAWLKPGQDKSSKSQSDLLIRGRKIYASTT
jgi:hypothetical protein